MSAPVSKTPFVLLGLLTLLTVAGPFAISITIRGGPSPRWPPDRPIEWWTFGIVIVAYLAVMGACLTIGLLGWRRTVKPRDNAEPRDGAS